MKKILIATVAAVAMSGAASAADMSMPMKARPAPAPSYSWTGCYVDAGVGYNVWNQDHNVTFAAPPAQTVQTTDGGRNWLGRVGGGCDYQFALGGLGQMVVGAFADYDFMNNGSGNNTPNEILAGNLLTATETERHAWSAGGRIGFLITPTILTYFDGGYTQAHFTQSVLVGTVTGLPSGFAYPNFNTGGWFTGGGFETPLSSILGTLPPGLFLRSEYRLNVMGSKNLAEFATATGIADGNIEHVKSYSQTVTTSLVYRFNWH